jgi:hypothetical protein
MKLDRRQLLVAGVTGVASTALTAATQRAAPPTEAAEQKVIIPPQGWVKNTRGKISYISDDGKERGREWFSFSRREDGQVTLRAYCEIDDGRVERDVVQSMTANFAPLDCFVRLHIGGKFSGTGWMRFTDTEAECEVYSTVLGRVQQRMALPMPAATLVSHPISSDALLMAKYDHSKSDRIQGYRGGMSTSQRLDGGSGPFLSASEREAQIEYVGPESITTAAGRFDTHHYRLLMDGRPDGKHPSYDLWVTHPDYLLIRGEVRGYLNNKTGYGRYDLVEYSA